MISIQIGAPSGNVTAVAQYIQSNQIPIIFVVMLLLQFLSMLIDRSASLLVRVRSRP